MRVDDLRSNVLAPRRSVAVSSSGQRSCHRACYHRRGGIERKIADDEGRKRANWEKTSGLTEVPRTFEITPNKPARQPAPPNRNKTLQSIPSRISSQLRSGSQALMCSKAKMTPTNHCSCDGLRRLRSSWVERRRGEVRSFA